VESQFLFDFFCNSSDCEHSIDRNYFCFPLMVHLFVKPHHWLCFLLESPHSQFYCLRIIVSSSTCFPPFDQPLRQYFVVTFDEKQTLYFKIIANNTLPILLVFKISWKT
jgi:hypothetical protein